MSGESYTYVRRTEVEQLQRAAKRADALAAQQRLLEQQQRAREAQAQQLKQQLVANEARYEQHVRSLGQEVQALEKATKSRFDEQRQTFQRELEVSAKRQRDFTESRVKTLDDRLQRLDVRLSHNLTKVDERVTALATRVGAELRDQRRETLDLLQTQTQQFDTALRQHNAILQANIDALATTMQQRLHSERELAEGWLEHLRQELSFIRDRYRHEHFAPGQLAQLEQRLQLATTNHAHGVYQSAISSGQEGFLQARQLREQLELLELQWEQTRQLAHDSATAALLLMDEHRLIQYQLAPAHTLEVEVDYWTEGRWLPLRERLAQWQQHTGSANTSLSQRELQTLQHQADAAQDEALALVALAKNAALSSIQRHDLQEVILEQLATLGFQHEDSSYEGGDARRAFHLKLRNGNGEEMVTIVAPTGDDFTNRVTFDFFDHSPNEEVREQRLNLIREQLEAEGELAMDKVECDPAYAGSNAPEVRRDFAQVRSGRV